MEKKLFGSEPITNELPQAVEDFPGLLGSWLSFEIKKCRHSIPLRFFDKICGYKIGLAFYAPTHEMSGIWILYKLEDIHGIRLMMEVKNEKRGN
jgi:hypothetical protein